VVAKTAPPPIFRLFHKPAPYADVTAPALAKVGLEPATQISFGMTARFHFLQKGEWEVANGEKQMRRAKAALDFLHALHVAHTGDFAHADDDALQVLEVGDVGNQVNRGSSEFLNPLRWGFRFPQDRLSRTSFRSRFPCRTATTCNGTVSGR
jgi:hypothetical protein